MKKILLVEDDADIAKALTIRLKHAGFIVHTAQDGLMGVCTAAKQKPDLMILDITMPAGDGFTVAERVRDMADVPDAPVIFITASKRPEYRRMAEEFGAAGFFEKPYESEELLGAVRATLGLAPT